MASSELDDFEQWLSLLFCGKCFKTSLLQNRGATIFWKLIDDDTVGERLAVVNRRANQILSFFRARKQPYSPPKPRFPVLVLFETVRLPNTVPCQCHPAADSLCGTQEKMSVICSTQDMSSVLSTSKKQRCKEVDFDNRVDGSESHWTR